MSILTKLDILIAASAITLIFILKWLVQAIRWHLRARRLARKVHRRMAQGEYTDIFLRSGTREKRDERWDG